jgi:hypothetical protein
VEKLNALWQMVKTTLERKILVARLSSNFLVQVLLLSIVELDMTKNLIKLQFILMKMIHKRIKLL